MSKKIKKRQIKNILLIEDDTDQTDLVRISIEESNLPYELSVSHTGRDALEKISNTHFDVIFIDYRLPDLNGLEVLKRIRTEQEKTRHYSVLIFITGGGSEQVAVEAIRNGAFDYIVKSFDYQALIPKILDDLESYFEEKFNLGEMHLIVFKKGKTGPDIHVSTPSLPFRQSPDNILPKIGVSLFFLVGMGESYNEGLFGPVPISDEEEFSALVFATFIADESLTDARMKGQNYVLICLVFPKSLVPFISSRREEVELLFRKFSNQFIDIKHLSENALIELRKQFFAPLQKVRMELELSYSNKQLQEQKYENYIFTKKLSEKIIEITKKLKSIVPLDSENHVIDELAQLGIDAELIVSLKNQTRELLYEKVSLTEFLNEITLSNKNILEIELSSNIKEDKIEIDKDLFQKFNQKLLLNSSKMHSTKLYITISNEGSYFRLDYIANGLSVDKNKFSTFFDPFNEIDTSFPGNLGFTLVKEIVIAFHGRIWVEYSKNISSGLTIVVLLPKRKTI